MCSHHAYGRVGYIGGQQVPVRFSPFTGYWCGHRCNTVSSFGPTQFNRDVRKLERVQGRGHKFQLGRFKVDILLYQEGSATLEWRGGGMSILWCLQGSLTKPLTLSCVDDSPSSGSRLDLDDFPPIPASQHLWDAVSDSRVSSQARGKGGIQELEALKENKIWKRTKFLPLLSPLGAVTSLPLRWSRRTCWQRRAGWQKPAPSTA